MRWQSSSTRGRTTTRWSVCATATSSTTTVTTGASIGRRRSRRTSTSRSTAPGASGAWHLGVEDGEGPSDTKGHYKFPLRRLRERCIAVAFWPPSPRAAADELRGHQGRGRPPARHAGGICRRRSQPPVLGMTLSRRGCPAGLEVSGVRPTDQSVREGGASPCPSPSSSATTRERPTTPPSTSASRRRDGLVPR